MKHTHVLAAFLLLTCTPLFAAQKPVALTLKPLSTEKAVTVDIEYTMFENGNADENAYGVALRYDKAFAPLKKDGDYWSWNLGGYWNSGEIDAGNGAGRDFTVMGIRYGVDANFVVAPRTTVFVGPRVGYAQYEPDGGDAEGAITYGFATGVRYQMENSSGVVECGFMHTWYAYQEEAMGTEQSNGIFVGAGFAF